MAINFLSSSARRGSGPFGSVPAPIGVPSNLYQQTAGVAPGLPGLTGQASGVIGGQLGGVIDPGDAATVQDRDAAWAVAAGMPAVGSGTLSTNKLPRDLGIMRQQLEQQGVGNYLNFLSGVGRSMTDPGLAAQIADRNAVYAAAPDPAAAAAEMDRRWMQKYNLTRGSYSGSPTWRDLTTATPARILAGPGGTVGVGGPDSGFGGPPIVSASSTATGSTAAPFTPNWILSGNTLGGGGPQSNVVQTYQSPADDVLASILDMSNYFADVQPQSGTATASSEDPFGAATASGNF